LKTPHPPARLVPLRVRPKGKKTPKGLQSALVLPYAFSIDSMGFTVGVGGLVKGYGQEQLVLGATAFGSSDETASLWVMVGHSF